MADHPDTVLYVVGSMARRWFAQRNIPIEKSFLYTAQNPTWAAPVRSPSCCWSGMTRVRSTPWW